MLQTKSFLFILAASGCMTFLSAAHGTLPDANWTILDSTDPEPGIPSSKFSNVTHASNQTGNFDNTTKNDQFDKCPTLELGEGEYIIEDGLAIITVNNNESINSSWYELGEDYLIICYPGWNDYVKEPEQTVAKFSESLLFVNVVGMGLSMVCILLHLIAFIAVKEFRNLPGWNLATLCCALFGSNASYLFGKLNAIRESGSPCVATGISLHFFFLASFLWMNAIAFDILKSLINATGKLQRTSTKFRFSKYLLYSVYSWGTALAFVALGVFSEYTEYLPKEYRPSYGVICSVSKRKALWVFLAAPTFLLIGLNAVFFGVSAYIVFSNRMKGDERKKHMLKKHLITYSKLATIMGLTWFTGILAGAINTVTALWYGFVALSTLQGLFIFLAFTLTKKVQNLVIDRIGFKKKSTTGQIAVPTFQTYVFSTDTCGKSSNQDVNASSYH